MVEELVGQVVMEWLVFGVTLYACMWAGYQFCLWRHASEKTRWARYYQSQEWFLALHCAGCPDGPGQAEPADQPCQLPTTRSEVDAA